MILNVDKYLEGEEAYEVHEKESSTVECWGKGDVGGTGILREYLIKELSEMKHIKNFVIELFLTKSVKVDRDDGRVVVFIIKKSLYFLCCKYGAKKSGG